MRKALGATVEDECRLGVHKIANVSFWPPSPCPVSHDLSARSRFPS